LGTLNRWSNEICRSKEVTQKTTNIEENGPRQEGDPLSTLFKPELTKLKDKTRGRGKTKGTNRKKKSTIELDGKVCHCGKGGGGLIARSLKFSGVVRPLKKITEPLRRTNNAVWHGENGNVRQSQIKVGRQDTFGEKKTKLKGQKKEGQRLQKPKNRREGY